VLTYICPSNNRGRRGFCIWDFQCRVSGLGVRFLGFCTSRRYTTSFHVSGLGVRLSGNAFRVSGIAIRVSRFGHLVSCSVFWVIAYPKIGPRAFRSRNTKQELRHTSHPKRRNTCSGLWISGFRFRVSGISFQVSCFGFQDQGLGFQVPHFR
jgi:hypothetical protein